MTINHSILSVPMQTESNHSETNENKKRTISDSHEDDLLVVGYEDFFQIDEEKEEFRNSNSVCMESSEFLDIYDLSNTSQSSFTRFLEEFSQLDEERDNLPESLQYSYTGCMEELTRILSSQVHSQAGKNSANEGKNSANSLESLNFSLSQLLVTDIPDLPSRVDNLYAPTKTILDLENQDFQVPVSQNFGSQAPPISVDEVLTQTQPLPAEVLSQDFDHRNYLGRIRYTNSSGEQKYFPINIGSVVLVGRHKTCQIYINDPAISSNQLTIKTTTGSNGPQVLCYNMGSNTTEINGVKLDKNGCHELTDKSMIILNHKIILQYRIKKDMRIASTESSNNARYTIENKIIGVGAYGKVSRARDNSTGKFVAVKTVKKTTYRNSRITDRKKKIQNEIDIMKLLDHQNVLNVLGVEENEEDIYIFLPYVSGGNLFEYITSQPGCHIPENRARFIFWQLVKALQYLHQNLICHRDIKPENILIHNPCSYPKVVLCDFGMAKKHNIGAMQSVCGTWNYSAPEIVQSLISSSDVSDSQNESAKRRKTEYSYKVDCWSMGVLLFAMLSGSLPFYIDNTSTLYPERKLFRQIVRGKFNMNLIPKDNISVQGEDIIKQLLCLDPSTRLDMFKAENHGWIKPYISLLNDIFEKETQAEASAGPQVSSQPSNFY